MGATIRSDRRLRAYSAAGIFGGAAFLGLFEQFIPGGPKASLAPGLAALAVAPALAYFGTKLPDVVVAALGPAGVVLIGVALATSPGPGDGAVLYMWPVVWTAFFYGLRGAILIVVSIGVCHALVLWSLPGSEGYPDRWFDVVVSVAIVAFVVELLARRSDQLLLRVAAEARTDTLTALLNRRGFDERAEVELARARRDNAWLAIVSFDIDYFKRVNDEWGHDVGDRVLTHFGQVLTACSREVDVVARIGGEEFAVLLPGCATGDAAAFSERVREVLAITPTDLPVVRVSAGVAADEAPDELASLVLIADTALYAAKRSGRNRTQVAQGHVPGTGPGTWLAASGAPQPKH